MPLDRHAKRLLDMLAAGRVEGAALAAPQVREAMEQLARVVDVRNVAIAEIEELVVPSSAADVPVRRYRDDTATAAGPALVYLHGGAGVFGSVATHDGLCRLLAKSSRAQVFSVEYRRGPEWPFPAALEDAGAATQFVFDHAARLGVDARRIALGGDSAGGALTIATCMERRDCGAAPLALQLLLCPVTDLSRRSASWEAMGTGHFLERATLDWAIGQWIPGTMDLSDARISPLRARDFSRLPAAHIHTAEYDPLLDEGRAYASALEAAAVPVTYACHDGLIHHFYAMAGAIPSARVVTEAIGAALGRALAAS